MELSNLSDEHRSVKSDGKIDLYGEIVKRYQNKLFNYLFVCAETGLNRKISCRMYS